MSSDSTFGNFAELLTRAFQVLKGKSPEFIASDVCQENCDQQYDDGSSRSMGQKYLLATYRLDGNYSISEVETRGAPNKSGFYALYEGYPKVKEIDLFGTVEALQYIADYNANLTPSYFRGDTYDVDVTVFPAGTSEWKELVKVGLAKSNPAPKIVGLFEAGKILGIPLPPPRQRKLLREAVYEKN